MDNISELKTKTSIEKMEAFPSVDSTLDVILNMRGKRDFLNSLGNGIPTKRLRSHDYQSLVPDFEHDFVIESSTIKIVAAAVDMNLPLLLFGFHGTGKTSLAKVICAGTNRPMWRVQHTGNMEESDVVGQILVRDGGTYFSPGPLPLAMRYGWVYLADEYDNAPPNVSSVYQAVLEGDDLNIKEATPEWRQVKPHPDFRFIATGNTNGSGDESGLYAGTNIGNAANYSRFGVTHRVSYIDKRSEIDVLKEKAGLTSADASNLVTYANLVRDAFMSAKMGNTCSTREIINAAKLGRKFGSFKTGCQLAHSNRMSDIDQVTCDGLTQRVFG